MKFALIVILSLALVQHSEAGNKEELEVKEIDREVLAEANNRRGVGSSAIGFSMEKEKEKKRKAAGLPPSRNPRRPKTDKGSKIGSSGIGFIMEKAREKNAAKSRSNSEIDANNRALKSNKSYKMGVESEKWSPKDMGSKSGFYGRKKSGNPDKMSAGEKKIAGNSNGMKNGFYGRKKSANNAKKFDENAKKN